MRKCLLLAAVLLSVFLPGLRAQNTFDLKSDTACVGQLVQPIPHTMNASSYYWGYCSGYLNTIPLDDNMGSGFSLNFPSGIEIGKDGDNYYGFAINALGNQLLRFNFGTSLLNTPTVTNFGSIDTTVCPSPNSIHLMQDSNKWFLFMCGGGGPVGTKSTIARFDFSYSLANVPNGTNMGNIGNLLDDPQGIFVAREGLVYYGFVVNAGNDRLIRLEFGKNVSKTPTATNLGNIGNMNNPNDIGAIYDQGNWYFLIPNQNGGAGGNGSLTRLYFGNTLSNTPVGATIGGLTGGGPNPSKIRNPTAISIIKDCGSYYAFITNTGNNTISRVNIPALSANTYSGTILTTLAGFNAPADITRIIRNRDSLYAFIVNNGDNTLSRLIFPQCQATDVQSSTLAMPPGVRYKTPGVYNIYLALNEGQPNMSVDCKQIYVEAVPPMTITHDTLICQGDTVQLSVATQNAINYYYSPAYNVGDTQGRTIKVYPEHNTTYHIRIPYFDGCEVDTVVHIDVSSVKSDAGPDRTIFDGASTIVGGPYASLGSEFIYEWFPTTYISNPFVLNPTVNPRTDLTYYLKVTNVDGCIDIDTVNVKVSCNDFNLPNAFAPGNEHDVPRRFGLLNRKVEQLNYFRIFDRWGNLVFSTTDKTNQWDGTVNGNPAPFGVYVWEADGFCEQTQEHLHKTGNVTLIR